VPPESTSERPTPVASFIHHLTIPDAIVIVGALAFAGFLCARGADVQSALITTVCAVSALMLVVAVPRAALRLIRSLLQPGAEQ